MEPLLRILMAVGSVFVCLIPERYRQWWPTRRDAELRGPAIASGILETIIGAPGATLYFAVALNSAKSGLGVAGLILNPYFFLSFMFVEGLFRMLAALVSHQVLPTLPLQIIAWLHDAGEKKTAERELGPLVTDRIERKEGKSHDLRVLSCRPKKHWNPFMTIRFDGQFYQLLREEEAPGERKFGYLLRKNPETRLVVVVYEYRPDDVLNPDAPPRRWQP